MKETMCFACFNFVLIRLLPKTYMFVVVQSFTKKFSVSCFFLKAFLETINMLVSWRLL